MSITWLARLAPLAVTALLAGCGSSSVAHPATPASPHGSSSATTPAPVTDAESARARWQQTGPDDYSFTVRYSCFCATFGSWRVDVEDGKVTRTRPLDDQLTGTGPNEYVGTVDALLAEAVRAEGGDAASIDAVYDPETGVPTKVSIDWIAGAVDDEIAWDITALKAR